jgi:hypothetical protein
MDTPLAMKNMVNNHIAWHITGILLVVALFILNRESRRAHILLYALFRWPGTALHETSHMVTGLILWAKPSRLSLLPRQDDSSNWRLGSVSFTRITAFNAVPIGLAPLGLLFVAWLFWRNWFFWFRTTAASILCLYVVLFYLCSSVLPSRQDLRIALNWRSILLYGIAAAIIVYIYL